MRALDRKLLRNLGTMKGQVVAIVVIIACGVASFVAAVTAYRGLDATRNAYYRRYRMADVFAPVKRAPRAVLDALRRVPGVRSVEGRIVYDVTIDLPELPQPASGRVLSVPDRHVPILNDLFLTSGRWFDGDGTGEVIVAGPFAKAHHLEVGDVLRVLMNGKKEGLRIVGIALSPEFVYMIRGAGEIFPDPEHFTVLWFSRTFAEAVFDAKDAINEVVATTSRGTNVQDVIFLFDRVLDPYGAFGAYARKDQASNHYLANEIDGLEATATLIPAVFLGVAAFVLHMLLARWVRTQRIQIAVFRAFGYGTGSIVRHYLGFALLVGFLGALVGVGLGLYFARHVLEMYRTFFSFPVLVFGVDPVALPFAFLISLGFSAAGALGAVRAAVRLAPAEGLHPEAPPVYRRTLLERVGVLWRRLGFVPRMVLRRLARAKGRAAFTVLGLSLSISILVLTFSSYDAMDALIDSQFRLVEHQDVTVAFHEERGIGALYELRHVAGVRYAEGELAVPVRLVNGWHERRTGITGLAPDHRLLGLLDRDLEPVPLPADGLLLSRKLAELLGVRKGETIEVRVEIGRKPRLRVPVSDVVDEYLGAFAYARRDVLARWLGESDVLTGARLLVDADARDDVGRALKDLPDVSGVVFKDESLRVFRKTISESQDVMLSILVLFAGAIIFGVLYNTARIALAERRRELGALRVLGYTLGETARLLFGENLALVVLALVPGLALGVAFSYVLTKAYETELYRFPFVVSPQTLLLSAALTLAFAVLANLAVLKPLRRLDLVEVLKEKE